MNQADVVLLLDSSGLLCMNKAMIFFTVVKLISDVFTVDQKTLK